MPLHAKHSLRTALLDDVFASDDLAAPLPRHRFPSHNKPHNTLTRPFMTS
ncbi:hypothetical protein ACLQ81_15575 [Bordetella avium]|nr:hypothetical protein [Bordetella avium]